MTWATFVLFKADGRMMRASDAKQKSIVLAPFLRFFFVTRLHCMRFLHKNSLISTFTRELQLACIACYEQ